MSSDYVPPEERNSSQGTGDSGPFFTSTQFDYPKFHPGDPDWRNKPVAPTNVSVTKLASEKIRIQWKARHGQVNALAIHPGDAYWSVRSCPANLAGHQVGNGNVAASAWNVSVMEKSKEIDSRPYGKDGDHFSLEYINSDGTLDSAYILVVGIVSSIFGDPSTPAYINYGDSTGVPGNVNPGLDSLTKILTPYPYLEIVIAYVRPDVTTNFGGVHPHVLGYDGNLVPQEVGQIVRWDQSLSQSATLRMVLESGQGNGVAHFTFGSATVTKVSGSLFSASWNGRKIIVDNAANASTTATINTAPSAGTMTLTGTWGGATGSYTYLVLNLVTIYMVQIGPNGERPGDITTCNTVIF